MERGQQFIDVYVVGFLIFRQLVLLCGLHLSFFLYNVLISTRFNGS